MTINTSTHGMDVDMILLNGRNGINEEKQRLFVLQNGKCPLCGRDLNPDVNSNHLDHDHALDGTNAGKVRSLLCIFCNVLEGEVKHKFDSSGLKSRGVEYVDWLKSLIEYYESDYSKNNIHPQFVPDTIKSFKRLNKPEMIEKLESIDVAIPAKATKESLIVLFRKNYKKFLMRTLT